MQLKYLSQTRFKETSSLLSATRQTEQLSLQKNTSKELKTILKTKKILKVYIEAETNKKFVDAVAAYALGFSKVRAIMTGDTRYKEITNDVINKLKERDYEIEYINLPKKEKQKIQVFYTDNKYYIGLGAAYALGYIEVKEFNNSKEMYGPLLEKQLESIKYNFIVEFENIKHQEGDSKIL